MLAQADASNIANKSLGQQEKQSLLAMKALIEQSLNQIEAESGENAVKEEQCAKVEDLDDVDMVL